MRIANDFFTAEKAFLDQLVNAYNLSEIAPGEVASYNIAGGKLSICPQNDHRPLNRLIGLINDEISHEDIMKLIRLQNENPSCNIIVDIPSFYYNTRYIIASCGFNLIKSSRTKFIRDNIRNLYAPAESIEIRQLNNTDEERDFGKLCQHGFQISDELIDVYAKLNRDPAFMAFGAFQEHSLVSIGGVTIAGDEAYLNPGVTLNTHRGRGLQLAMMEHRLNACIERGVKRVSGDTTLPEIGANNPSMNNFRRLGFQIACEVVRYELNYTDRMRADVAV